jgi:hypothetical protein
LTGIHVKASMRERDEWYGMKSTASTPVGNERSSARLIQVRFLCGDRKSQLPFQIRKVSDKRGPMGVSYLRVQMSVKNVVLCRLMAHLCFRFSKLD